VERVVSLLDWNPPGWKPFSTTEGLEPGRANKRAMLSAMGGPDTIKKRFLNSPDGSVTMAHTRGPGAQPEFVTTRTGSEASITYQVYMESGQLEWSYPGEGNPTRYDPATWNFLDIPTTSDYLGKIPIKSPEIGQQKNVPSLSEGMDSLSVGYPRGADPWKDAENKDAYSGATVMKKITSARFPSSLFSGKMRSFIQAQYGAKESTSENPLSIDVFGTSAILKYTYAGETLQFGLWAHASPGIFTASDGTFWLLNITNPTGSLYVVTAYAIKQTSLAAKALMLAYKAFPNEKLEAYLFAHSVIDVAHPVSAGEFAGANGGPLAYGWKWNKDGSKAAIVVHQVLGTGAADFRWNASVMHVDIAYSAGSFSVSCTVETGGEWTDGWGEYNIFVPEQETQSAPLVCASLAMDTDTVKPAFPFSNIPVYGYFVDDVWKPVTLSRTENDPTERWVYSSYGIIRDPNAGAQAEGRYHFDYYYMNGSINSSASYRSITNSTGMSVSFSGVTITGHIATTDYLEVSGKSEGPPFIPAGSWSPGADGLPTCSVMDWPGAFGGPLEQSVGPCLGEVAMNAWTYGVGGTGAVRWAQVAHPYRQITTNAHGVDYAVWALVIPALDAEALYVPHSEFIVPSAGTVSWSFNPSISYGLTAMGFTSTPDTEDDPYRGWWNIESGLFASPWQTPAHAGDTFTEYGSYPLPDKIGGDEKVLCFNSAIDGESGEPSGSYYALFNVSRDYPYFDRGMWMMTSFGKRYVGSELPASPGSVQKLPFVGWA